MREFIDLVLEFLWSLIEEYWLFWLFFITFTEKFIQPIPVDPLIIASTKFFPFSEIMIILFFATVFWSLAGYFLWKFLWKKVFLKLFWQKLFDKWEKFMKKYWVYSVIIAWITPIPYKIITWLAGILNMNIYLFVIAAIIWRMPRFYIMFLIWDKIF